jgi:hypothetical protein
MTMGLDPANPPKPGHIDFLNRLRGQAEEKQLYEPLSEDGEYYAYLSTVDPVPIEGESTSQSWDVMFELVSKSLLDVALFKRSVPSPRPPDVPILVFEVEGADEETLFKTLGVETADDLAEGSWFELTIEKGAKPGTIEGTLFDAGIGRQSSS